MQCDIRQMELYLLLSYFFREHRNRGKIVRSVDELLWQDAMSNIPNGKGSDDMNFSVVHVICNDGSFPPTKKIKFHSRCWG
jgi:hypothetical protein